jgi:succinate dehydrogenase/fumarate reductase cytochrome b subunit
VTNLDDYYRQHPYPFFVGHMLRIVLLLVAFVTGILYASGRSGSGAVHVMSGILLFVVVALGLAEAAVAKAFFGARGSRGFAYRVRALLGSGAKKQAAIYASYCVLAWIVNPLMLAVVTISGLYESSATAGAMSRLLPIAPHPAVHGVAAVTLIIFVVAHLLLSVSARQIRSRCDAALARQNAEQPTLG